jgi:biofilm PGA synthesis protein PgaD
MKDLIIDTPSLQSLKQKYLSTFLTFVFWVVWIFLWTPLITLIGWLLGIDWMYFQMIELGGYEAVANDFMYFLLYVTIMAGMLAIWASYNFFRFRNVDRRLALPPTDNSQLSEFFKVDMATLSQKQHTQCLSVSFDDEGNIISSTELSLLTSSRIT